MKNKSVVIGILIIVAVCLITTGCGFYNLVDSTEFKEHFAALGYTTSDTEKGLYDADSYLVATKSDMPFKIEYYEFKDEVEAKKAYVKFTDDSSIVNYISADTKNLETKGAVFTKFVAESSEDYIVISRVKNTIIFVDGTQDYKDEISTLLEDIQY